MAMECGTERIAGCQFNLSVMSDDFVDVILGSLDTVDMSKVWRDTDDVTTCVRGRLEHVFDVVKAVYMHAVKTGKHVEMSGTFSIGCPGDSSGDTYMDATAERMNEANVSDISQKAGCKFALYPMNTSNYMDVIYEQIDLSKARGVEVSPSHYSTRLDGEVNDIYKAMEEAFTKVQEVVSHTTMTFTISANSPSSKK
ncbi:YkoF family thiamine/hydroxymethylpyrimidine-binding protein [Salinicoccus hispanicus]|uniref:Thiamine-binding protein n=1 Tax=Salinicoccus hispanicus TaxID=157225 RepID=A0A6N8U193_9STAP|nr:YkoF family thiamine/hydroxymethylpyrimidine-binding protein [Salinicoccus hispanicus]MXQ51107.1 thiamine-binding protein [Salinicoccus hispanicus]